MDLRSKLLTLFRRQKPVVPPPASFADSEFLEAIAKLPRERYQLPLSNQEAISPASRPEQAA